jgi:hypothetical protein
MTEMLESSDSDSKITMIMIFKILMEKVKMYEIRGKFQHRETKSKKRKNIFSTLVSRYDTAWEGVCEF